MTPCSAAAGGSFSSRESSRSAAFRACSGNPAALAHLIAGALRVGVEEKQKLLEEVDVAQRLRHLSRILARELEVV
ncbi:MAG TPA: LON peptidase substrate-binding domain-containing protein, partial [Solirubrobacterales bacterium]|nr:LON peptidase substrate-binding domain-containing protein [Solirubrobacterales bacterium]